MTNPYKSSLQILPKPCRRPLTPETGYLIFAFITALFLTILLFFIVVILLSVAFISMILLRMGAYLRENFGKIWDG